MDQSLIVVHIYAWERNTNKIVSPTNGSNIASTILFVKDVIRFAACTMEKKRSLELLNGVAFLYESDFVRSDRRRRFLLRSPCEG